jgi:hypothetical protein
MAKKKKKWKSRIKKALKLAAMGGAGYLAAKAFGGRKGPVSTVGQPIGVGRVADMPANLGETFHQKQPKVPDRITSPLRPSVPRKKVWTGKQFGDLSEGMFYSPKYYKKGGKVTELQNVVLVEH